MHTNFPKVFQAKINIRVGRTDLLNFVSAIVWVIVFRIIYENYLHPLWGYSGYNLSYTPTFGVVLTNILAVIPILFYSVKQVASNFISIIIYGLWYIPTIITMQYYFENYNFTVSYQLMFMGVIICFFLCDKLVIGKSKIKSVRTILGLRTWVWLGVGVAMVVVFIYGQSSMRLVSFEDVYDLRFGNRYISLNFPFVGYCEMWLTSFFGPLLITISFVKKQWRYFILGTAMEVLIYITTGAKGAILIPIFALGVYFFLNKIGFKWLLSSIPLLSILLYLLYISFGEYGNVIYSLCSIILVRTVSMAGLTSTLYVDFFSTSPYTYYSHIGIVNKLFKHYPYDDVLGRSVSRGLFNIPKDSPIAETNNANTNFIITDGIAAYGGWGVVIITILFICFVVYLNKITERHDQKYVMALLFAPLMSLMNVSFFTVLLSSGLLFMLVFFRFSNFSNGINANKGS